MTEQLEVELEVKKAIRLICDTFAAHKVPDHIGNIAMFIMVEIAKHNHDLSVADGMLEVMAEEIVN